MGREKYFLRPTLFKTGGDSKDSRSMALRIFSCGMSYLTIKWFFVTVAPGQGKTQRIIQSKCVDKSISYKRYATSSNLPCITWLRNSIQIECTYG